jgi:hypothetical protein
MEQNEQIPNITSITSFRCSSFPWCAYRKDLPTYKFMSMPIRTDPISQVHGVPVSGAKVLPPEMHGMPMPPMPDGIPEAMTIHLRAPKMLWGTDTTWGDFEIFKELSERNPEARFKPFLPENAGGFLQMFFSSSGITGQKPWGQQRGSSHQLWMDNPVIWE